MSEESPENYNSGDIVWVKLGSSWWPGEVKDLQELPSEEFEFKKPPLAIVKFFDEDSYEYVKNWGNIYPFNCDKKNDFIKKGMVGFRASVAHMEKFPKDVIQAEEKMGGNPNILSDPMFLPEKRRSYADTFGTPSPKSKDKKSRSNTKTPNAKDMAHITHRRFLGVDDYKAYICIQYPGKDRAPDDNEAAEVLRINREPEQEFNCHTCSFTTKRLEVMILHTKSHIRGVYVPSSRKKMPMVRKRKEKTKKSRGSDMIQSDSSSSDGEFARQKKRKPKSQGVRKSKAKKTKEAPKETREAADVRIRNELLAVWDDTDEEEEISFNKTMESEGKTTNETNNDTVEESLIKTLEESSNVPADVSRSIETTDKVPDESIEKESEVPLKHINKDIHEAIQSCFDFDEEEEHAKAPMPTVSEVTGCKESTPVEGEKDEKSTKSNKDIQEEIKSCFDFDEDEEDDHAFVTKATAGRKIPRVIPLSDRKKSVEEIDRSAILKESESFNRKPNEADETFKELMELTAVPDLPDVQNTLKCEQNFHNIKTIKFPDKLDKKDTSEVATKLTNPKKRFVKSFEDFELMQNEIRRREEEQMGLSRRVYCGQDSDSEENQLELTMLKTQIMSKIREEVKIHEESKSKKIQETKQKLKDEAVVDSILERKPAGTHRTPRSKILESYMNDTKKQEIETVPKPEEVVKEPEHEEIKTKKDIVPPKKSKWSRRGSHPKKDKNLFRLQDIALQESNELQSNDKVKEPEKTDSQEALPPNTLPSNNDAASGTSNNLNNDISEEFKHISEVLDGIKPVTESMSFVEEKVEEKIPEPIIVEVNEKSLTESNEHGTILSIQNEPDAIKTPEEMQSNDPPQGEADNVTTKDSNELVSNDEETSKLQGVETMSQPKEEASKNIPQEEITPQKEVAKSVHQEESECLTEKVETESAPEEEEQPKSKKEEEEVWSMLQVEEEPKSMLQIEEAKSMLLNQEEAIKVLQVEEGATNILHREEYATKMLQVEEDITKMLQVEGGATKILHVHEETKIVPQAEGEETEIMLQVDGNTLSMSQDDEKSQSNPEEEEAFPEVEEETKITPQEEERTTIPIREGGSESISETGEKESKSAPQEEHITSALQEEETYKRSPQDDEPKSTDQGGAHKTLHQEEEAETKRTHQEEEIEIAVNEEETNSMIEDLHIAPTEAEQIDEKIPPDDESVDLFQTGLEKVPDLPSNDQELGSLVAEETASVVGVEEEKQHVMLEEELVSKADDALELSNLSLEDRQLEPVKELVTESEKEAPVMIATENNLTREIDLHPGDAVSAITPPTEPVVEETVQSQPSTEVFSSISDTAVSISMDRLALSPKKSKKRKISGGNSVTSPIREDTAKDLLQVDDFVPLEKKKKEMESTENEIKIVEVEKQELKISEQTADCDTHLKAQQIVGGVEPQTTLVPEQPNKVEIECASSSVESFKFSIQTNLSNLTSREEMSALALATLSEIKMDASSMLEDKAPPKNSKIPTLPTEPELVQIEGNLTVVSEKDLADGQVEITSDQVISPKKPVMLSNFSMDFSDSASDSNSASETLSETSSKGTEFTQKAMTKQLKKMDNKKANAYERFELLNILEGNAEVERKPKEYTRPAKKGAMVDEICDFEEHIPSQIVCAANMKHDGDLKDKVAEKSTASKLLERLTEAKTKLAATKIAFQKADNTGRVLPKSQTVSPKNAKYIVKSTKSMPGTSKPIILSEQIIKPPTETPKSKKTFMDIEDVEAFVIHKDPKKIKFDEEDDSTKTKSTKMAGKAKILQQTIITPAGEIIQPTVNQAQADDNIFDINSMPIVLSDEILTPESIENMPIVISGESQIEKVVRKPTQPRIIAKTTAVTPQQMPKKTPMLTKHSKPPRILQTFSNKVIKNSPLSINAPRPEKYIIVPQPDVTTPKYVSKKPSIVKRTAISHSVVAKIPSIAPEPSGNKIMIVTNQQGQQQRLLLTPAQQKMLGYQNQRVTKTFIKGNVLQKSVLAAKTVPLVEACTSGTAAKSPGILGQKLVRTTASTALITTSHQVISNQSRTIKTFAKRGLQSSSQKAFSTTNKPQKTILIKNQHGQTVRKIQGTDDELLDKQVAEQLEAIKASSGMKFNSQSRQTPKTTLRRYVKKPETKPKGPPPLAGLHQSSKSETVTSHLNLSPVKKQGSTDATTAPPPLAVAEAKQDRPLNQLVIQDAVGNQTTITEGQILALPSETVDGQPQSYMLVTLDESGNLTPLNSEALMSLDPNLGLGGDLSNMVLQIDQGGLTDRPQPTLIKVSQSGETVKLPAPELDEAINVPVPEAAITETVVEQKVTPVAEPVTPTTNGDPGQQLIVTGDPIATQKFLESLTEGTTDLANILANADGNSILIQADGQQILINTNSDNQMMLSMNNDNMNASESTEGGGNPIFATQPNKSKDILAAALADTDVFQQEQHATQSKITSQLSPNHALYPMNVGSVLETSLTLNSPIMTPLEVPSTNSKKIPDDEVDILTRVPKNVDLPITITDPNISQTVANQQVASMIANELQANLELGLPISESTISAVSTGMNSPSYVYSLPTLDDSVDLSQKTFNSSMPLLNEDIEESNVAAKAEEPKENSECSDTSHNSSSQQHGLAGYLDEEEGRFTLGGAMCSSLSEPPPEMFDMPEANQNYIERNSVNIPTSPQDTNDNASKDVDGADLSMHADSSSDGSCEIPLQPQIVTKSLDLSGSVDLLKRNSDGPEEEASSKKCKFD